MRELKKWAYIKFLKKEKEKGRGSVDRVTTGEASRVEGLPPQTVGKEATDMDQAAAENCGYQI